MKVILSSNVPRYHYAAQALHQAGWLHRYIHTVSDGIWTRRIAKCLPDALQARLQTRTAVPVDESAKRSVWWPEILQQTMNRSRVVPKAWSNLITSHAFDLAAWPYVDACDVFHYVSPAGLRSAQKAKKLGAKIICDIRIPFPAHQVTIVGEEYERLGIRTAPSGNLSQERHLANFKNADYLFLNSSYSKRTFIAAGFPAGQIVDIALGTDITRFARRSKDALSPHRSEHTSKFRVIFAGHVTPGKGVHYLLDAFRQLHIKDMELILLGGVDSSMQSILHDALCSDDRICTLGHVPQVELWKYYRSGAVFVLPSLSDGWGLVTLEAMASGLPVIVTENTGSADAVRDGVDGFIVPIRDAAAIADKLLMLYEQPDLRLEMSEAAKARVWEFTWEKYCERLIAAYRRIFEQRQEAVQQPG